MHQSRSNGSKRYAATDTRREFEIATPNTPEWDDAAANYARTVEGWVHLVHLAVAALDAGDLQLALTYTNVLLAVDDRANSAQREATELLHQSPAISQTGDLASRIAVYEDDDQLDSA